MSEIEKGVPLPMVRLGPKPAYKNLLTMKVKESFAVPVGETDKLRQAVYHHAKVSGKKFLTATDENDDKKYRVWRIK